MTKPYNPLEKQNLAESVAGQLLRTDPQPLSDTSGITGAGVYAIYYTGAFPLYERIAALNANNHFAQPIYVGKAVPAGARRGLVDLDSSTGNALKNRLEDHAGSISQATSTLDIVDFLYRYLVVDDIWIPLGESILIQRFRPLWNHAVEGFGNHDPGGGRRAGRVSSWDTLHPGRSWADLLTGGPRHPMEEIHQRIAEAVADLPDPPEDD